MTWARSEAYGAPYGGKVDFCRGKASLTQRIPCTSWERSQRGRDDVAVTEEMSDLNRCGPRITRMTMWLDEKN